MTTASTTEVASFQTARKARSSVIVLQVSSVTGVSMKADYAPPSVWTLHLLPIRTFTAFAGKISLVFYEMVNFMFVLTNIFCSYDECFNYLFLTKVLYKK